jgi:hypothetical protein
MTFNHDLIVGKKIEHEVCSLIKERYPNARVIDGYFKGGDIYVPEKDFLIEVKHDEMSHETGNYLIEVKYDGVDSALNTTEAAWWVIVDKDYYIWVVPDTLRLIIRELKLKPRVLKGRGDIKSKTAYFIAK